MRKFILLFVVIGGVTAIANTTRTCCEPHTFLIPGPPKCWNPTTNKTSKMTALQCEAKVKLATTDLTSQGELILDEIDNENVTIETDRFCLGNQTSLRDVELKNLTLISVVCTGEEENILDSSVTGYCVIVSVVFLYITAIIYILLEELRDLLGKSLISFCLSLGIGMMILAMNQLMSYSDMKLCAVRGFLQYFFLISSYFWTNAISIQLLLCIRRPLRVNYSWRDFVYYAVYAWGIPAILTVVVAVVNYVPGTHPRPGIGLNHCWFYDTTRLWHYFYSIMSILIVANICIFAYTSVCLWRARFASTHVKALKYKFTMTIRLFVLMGVSWIFEFISSVTETSIFWAIIDVYNLLQGLLIFLVLVPFRRRVIKAMYKHGWLDCISGIVEKHLAVGEDDEQDVVEHTKDVPLDDQR